MAVHALHAHAHFTRPPRRGFALIELVLVVGIIGIIGAIAIPRITRAQSNAISASLAGDIRVFQGAIETYAVEHNNLSPAHKPNGVVSDEPAAFMARLLGQTDDVGNAGGIFGPYLSHPIRNPINGLRTIRIDGPAAGANTHGWRFDTATREVVSDHVTSALLAGKPADGQAVSGESLK